MKIKKLLIILMTVFLVLSMQISISADQLKNGFGLGMTRDEFVNSFIGEEEFQEDEESLIFYSEKFNAQHWVKLKNGIVVGVIVSREYTNKLFAEATKYRLPVLGG